MYIDALFHTPLLAVATVSREKSLLAICSCCYLVVAGDTKKVDACGSLLLQNTEIKLAELPLSSSCRRLGEDSLDLHVAACWVVRLAFAETPS